MHSFWWFTIPQNRLQSSLVILTFPEIILNFNPRNDQNSTLAASNCCTERKIFIRSDKTKTALDSNVTALVSHCLAQHKSLTIYPTTTTGYVQLLSFVAFHWFYSMNIILIRPFIRRPVAAAAARLAIYWWRCTFADHICSDSISNSTFLEMIKRWLCA